MAEVKPPEVVVIQIPSAVVRAELATDDDRFVVVETAALPMPRLFEPRAGQEEAAELLLKALRRLPPMTEAQVRSELAARGWTRDQIEISLSRARRLLLLEGSTTFGIDHITRIGYRNPDGQEVVAKTDRMGPDNQRVFVMRCGVCAHEYGSYGCDADIRRCPRCQDGPPAIAL